MFSSDWILMNIQLITHRLLEYTNQNEPTSGITHLPLCAMCDIDVDYLKFVAFDFQWHFVWLTEHLSTLENSTHIRPIARPIK